MDTKAFWPVDEAATETTTHSSVRAATHKGFQGVSYALHTCV